jgi:hypothetical protein
MGSISLVRLFNLFNRNLTASIAYIRLSPNIRVGPFYPVAFVLLTHFSDSHEMGLFHSPDIYTTSIRGLGFLCVVSGLIQAGLCSLALSLSPAQRRQVPYFRSLSWASTSQTPFRKRRVISVDRNSNAALPFGCLRE